MKLDLGKRELGRQKLRARINKLDFICLADFFKLGNGNRIACKSFQYYILDHVKNLKGLKV